MAMNIGGAQGSFKADINVTPLVDVMLVLLIIIMMLIAPMLHHHGAITLPEAGNSTEKPDTQGQTLVAIDSRSLFYVNALAVTAEELVPRVRRALEDKQEKAGLREGRQGREVFGDHGRHAQGADREHRAHHRA